MVNILKEQAKDKLCEYYPYSDGDISYGTCLYMHDSGWYSCPEEYSVDSLNSNCTKYLKDK